MALFSLESVLLTRSVLAGAPVLQAKESLDAVRAAAEAEVDHAMQQRNAVIQERDRTLEQVIFSRFPCHIRVW